MISRDKCWLCLLSLYTLVLHVYSEVAGDDEDCIEMISRDEWAAQLPKNVYYQTFPVQKVVIIHTVTQSCTTFSTCAQTVKNIQSNHMSQRHFDDIAYNFLIGEDGNVYEGVGWHKIGSHTRGHNNSTIGIAFIGNFNDKLPSTDALYAAEKLLDCGVLMGELDQRYQLFGHKQLSATQSPGAELMREISHWDHWSSSP